MQIIIYEILNDNLTEDMYYSIFDSMCKCDYIENDINISNMLLESPYITMEYESYENSDETWKFPETISFDLYYMDENENEMEFEVILKLKLRQ